MNVTLFPFEGPCGYSDSFSTDRTERVTRSKLPILYWSGLFIPFPFYRNGMGIALFLSILEVQNAERDPQQQA